MSCLENLVSNTHNTSVNDKFVLPDNLGLISKQNKGKPTSQPSRKQKVQPKEPRKEPTTSEPNNIGPTRTSVPSPHSSQVIPF